jgi:hypothetical protein
MLTRNVFISPWFVMAAVSFGLYSIAFGGCQVDGTRLTIDPGEAGKGWWELRGNWNQWFTGTPIATNLFITANHVGGEVGQSLIFQGIRYKTIARWSQDDLAIYEIDGTFSEFALLYEGTNEVGHTVVDYGRGMGVKTAVKFEGRTRGWCLDGPSDNQWSWGRGLITHLTSQDKTGGNGPMLYVSYDARLAQSQGMTLGDSGGAAFIRDGGVWKIAGVVWNIDSPYSLDGHTGFDAIVFDKRGLYETDYQGEAIKGFVNGGSHFKLVSKSAPEPVPGETWFSRISAHAAWIHEVVNHQIKPQKTGK